MVVSTLEPVKVGDEFDHLPSHMTVFPWFELPGNRASEFDDEMKEIIIENRLGTTQVGDVAQYGTELHPTSVRRLNRLGDSFGLLQAFEVHAALYRYVSSIGSEFDPTFTGLNYSPHISHTADRVVKDDEYLELRNLTVMAQPADTLRKKFVRAVYMAERYNHETTA